MCPFDATAQPPSFLSLPGSCTVVAEAVSVRLFGGDVPLLTFPRLGEIIAVARLDLIAGVPGTAVFAVPL
ncbi:hypothetical protein ANO14919_106690 [Xylariales sp. No.14919]|nr:hypothetical protein ANO14919_106690 [Xylariales sp. No.14919]